MIIGSLGVLDDVTVTRVAAVWELKDADPGASRRKLYGAGSGPRIPRPPRDRHAAAPHVQSPPVAGATGGEGSERAGGAAALTNRASTTSRTTRPT